MEKHNKRGEIYMINIQGIELVEGGNEELLHDIGRSAFPTRL